MQDRSIVHHSLLILPRRIKSRQSDSAGSDEEIDTSPSSKTALVCKLAQVPPEIWMTLSLGAK
jgi:hypothetical protein